MKLNKIILCWLALSCCPWLGQSPAISQHSLLNQTGICFSYPVPNSKVVFKLSYTGEFGIKLKYGRIIKRYLLIGALIEHSRFRFDDPQAIRAEPICGATRARSASGTLVGGIDYPLNKVIHATIQTGAGYSWMFITNKPNHLSKRESGFLIRPMYEMQFRFSTWGFSAAVAYPIIFEDFADDTGLDDATTRWWDFSAGIIRYF